MKKIVLLMTFTLFTNSLFSQQWDGNSNTTDNISRDGNVTIGGVSNLIDASKLFVKGSFRIVNGGILFGNYLGPQGNPGLFNISQLGNNLYIRPSFNGQPNIGDPTPIEDLTLVINNSTRIGMGTANVNCSTCNDYRLFVKDGIRTEKIKVDIAANSGWADYVFKKDYKLMSLKDVEHFINNNGHLPEVPSTEEAIKNGVELKEMNILLLKKIEELTLYTLQQQKSIEELTLNALQQKKSIEEQQKSIKMLEEKLSK